MLPLTKTQSSVCEERMKQSDTFNFVPEVRKTLCPLMTVNDDNFHSPRVNAASLVVGKHFPWQCFNSSHFSELLLGPRYLKAPNLNP